MQLHIADSLPLLLDRLDQELTSWPDPFIAPTIIVPNRNLRRWLQMNLAAKAGVAAHLDFHYLESGLSRLMSGGGHPVLQADPAFQQWSLLSALKPEAADTLELYRRTSHLHSLFRDYEYHRNPMIHAWHLELDSSLCSGPGLDIFALEQESGLVLEQDDSYTRQKQLYQSMLGRMHANGRYSFTEVADAALARGEFEDRPLFVFGLSRMSRLHLSILFRLSLHIPVHVFLFDVFGSSLQGREGGSQWYEMKSPEFKLHREANTVSVTHENLSEQEYSFHRDGLELLYLFRKGEAFLASRGSRVRWLVHGSSRPATLRQLKQRQISEKLVRVVEAPGLRREIEYIHDDILGRIDRDPSLHPRDFGILVPSMQQYRSHFEYVFRGRNELPFNLTDFSARETSRLGDAVRTILKFDQPLDRRTVFHLLSNPMVREKWRLQPEEYSGLLEKVDELNIFRGSQDSAFPVHTWKHGLRRLRLSQIMVGNGQAFQGYLPAAGESYEREAFSILADFVETLEAFRKELQGSPRPFQVIRKILETFLSLKHQKNESRMYLSLLDSLNSGEEHWERLGVRGDAVLAREWVLDSMKEVAGGIGEYLIQGVTISALQPMRPIPFRHLYVAGLREGDFPGFPLNHPEDLRRQYRLPGDSSLPDGNRFLFLEALASFSDTLTLSYVGRDLARDDEFQPSSVILELQDFLNLENSKEEIPTSLMSARYDGQPIRDPLQQKLLQQRWRAVRHTGNSVSEQEGSIRLRKTTYRPHQLVRLFSDPVRAFLEFRLNAHPLLDEDLSDVSDEPFRLLLQRRKSLKYLLRDLTPHYLNQAVEFHALLESMYESLILDGSAPAAFYADLDLQELRREIQISLLQKPEFLALMEEDTLFYSSSRNRALEELPFVRLQPSYRIQDLRFHFQIPCFSEKGHKFLFPVSGKPQEQDWQAAFLNILFFMMKRKEPLHHDVHLLSFKDEGAVYSAQLHLPWEEMTEFAGFLADELQTYGPLLFREWLEAHGQEHREEDISVLEEMLLDTWQNLQESRHPVLRMVMEKMDVSDLLYLLQEGEEDSTELPQSLEGRMEMRRRLLEVWQ